ncbi:hypothetical protein KEM56_000656, partial [Ascosphaera pollenicola]
VIAENFPSLALRLGISSKHVTGITAAPSTSAKRLSTASVSSSNSQEQRFSFINKTTASIPLRNIVAICKTEASPLSLDIHYLNGAKGARVFQAQFPTAQGCGLWLANLRSTLKQHRLTMGLGPTAIECVENILHKELDCDPDALRCFRVVRKVRSKVCAKASMEEKLAPEIHYLVIGAHKIHLIAPEYNSTECVAQECLSFGIMTLTSVIGDQEDDSFKLTFRLPFRKELTLHLSSASSWMIMDVICQRAIFLRPLWTRQPFVSNVESIIDNEDFVFHGAIREDVFVRTLVAYCAAYNVDTSNICYTIDYHSEDSPCFQLQSPANSLVYTARELLAIMRALRYNDLFTTISFAGISLYSLEGIYDIFGSDGDTMRTRDGIMVDLPEELKLSALSQEIRALALQNSSLRRVDFSRSISRVPRGSRDRGCGIPQAIFPLCRRRFTNIDWVTLTGIRLGATDLDYIVDAASTEEARLRGLEIGFCGLSPRDVDMIVSSIYAQEDTLEVMDISAPIGQLSHGVSQHSLSNLKYIRKLILSRIPYDQDKRPFFNKEILCNWRLEELVLNDTRLDQSLIGTLRDYLADPSSNTLRQLHLDRCGLTEQDFASFTPYMIGHSGNPRNLHLSLSGNYLHQDGSCLFEAIRCNHTPSHLTIQSMAFEEEKHFRELIEALRQNQSLEYLDISNLSLPHDVGLETSTALRRMFAENTTLKYLDISGDSAHMDSTRFGIGFNDALMGLTQNKALEVLKIERQKLETQGANSLASVLLENKCLREIHCEDNHLNVDALRVLANALAENYNLLYLPLMKKDRESCIQMIKRGSYRPEVLDPMDSGASIANSTKPKRSLRKTMADAAGSTASRLKRYSYNAPPTPASSVSFDSSIMSSRSRSNPSTSSSESTDAIHTFEEDWDGEMDRLGSYLQHNYELANGLVPWSKLNSRTAFKQSSKASDDRRPRFEFMKPVHIDREPDPDEELSLPVSLSEFMREIELETVFPPQEPRSETADIAVGTLRSLKHHEGLSWPRSLRTYWHDCRSSGDKLHPMHHSRSSPSLGQLRERSHFRKDSSQSRNRHNRQKRSSSSSSFGVTRFCKELVVSKLLNKKSVIRRASISHHLGGMRDISGPQQHRSKPAQGLMKSINGTLS